MKTFRSLLPLIGVVYYSATARVPTHTEEGFRVPQPNTQLNFPRDHGSHPDFKIEWWYLTGHLQSDEKRQWGFQATFFRFAGPLEGVEPSIPSFGQSQLFSTQVAISDIQSNTFIFDERLDRDGWDAVANTETLSIRHGPWSLLMTDEASERMHLKFNVAGDARLDIRLTPSKPKVIFGSDGTSRKGPDPAARSYYITFPRLSVSGKLLLNGEEHTVSGSAWMDHEIASRQLGDNLEGWDWTAIQLDDGREIKAYLLRQIDGQPSPFSQLIWVDRNGDTHYQPHGKDGFLWEKTSLWRSPHTGTDYPTTVRISTRDPETGEHRTFLLSPVIQDQEIRGSLNKTHYWEGACNVLDEAGRTIGKAYLELAGYATGLSDVLR